MKISAYDPSKDPEFLNFIKELEKESDRGIAIICHAYVEDLLKELLKKRLIEDKEFLKKLEAISFKILLTLCFIAGVVTKDEKEDIILLNDIRNKFAHRRKVINFNQAEIRDKCNNLRIPNSLRGRLKPRKKFIMTAGYYVQILNLKLKYIKKVKNIEVESRNLKKLDNLYI